MTDLKKLGSLLRSKHKKSGLKPRTYTKLVGVQSNQLENIFKGKPGTTFGTLEKLCTHFDIKIKFFDGDKELIL